MNILWLGFLSFVPILIVIIFLIGLKWPASKAMPLSYLSVLLIGYFVWGVPGNQIVGGTVKGIVTALGLLYIIFGSILLMYTLLHSGGLSQIRRSLMGISADRRVQIIIIAWLFGTFIEGASGFGTPGAVIGPLLIGLGFPALAAIISCMVIESSSASFGGVGTPIRLGLGSGLGQGNEPIVNEFASRIGIPIVDQAGNIDMFNYEQLLNLISHKVAILHFIAGFFIPLFLICLMTRMFGRNKSFSEGLAAWPFAIFASLAMTIPYLLVNFFLSYELTSMLGGLIGLAIVITAARYGFLVPKESWDFADRDSWDSEWIGSVEVEDIQKPGGMSTFLAWMPYVLVAVFILLTRLVDPVANFLNKIKITGPTVGGISSGFDLGYSPGTVFVAISLITFFLHGMKGKAYAQAWKTAMKTMLGASTTLIFSVPMVQVFINSQGGSAGYPKMPFALAEASYALAGGFWPLLAPVIAGVGAFISGSNTVSNMTFGLFQFKTAELITAGNPALSANASQWPIWILALQAVGGSAGTVTSISNIVAGATVVGYLGNEGAVIRKTFLIFAYYCLISGSVSYAYLYWQARGPFNLGSLILLSFTIISVYVLATNKARIQKYRQPALNASK